ncbi:hypothetical protein ABTZ99_44005, partial [Actinosynnema sp. NPDC002837]
PDGNRQPRIPPNGEWHTHHPDGTTTRASDDGYVPGTKDADKTDLDPTDAQDRAGGPGRQERPVGGPLRNKIDEVLPHVDDPRVRSRLEQLSADADRLDARIRDGEIPEAADRLREIRDLGDELRAIGDADPAVGRVLDRGPDFDRLGVPVGEPRFIRPDDAASARIPDDAKALYVVRDKSTGEILKVGETTGGDPLKDRFGRYALAGRRLGIDLEIEVREVSLPSGGRIRSYEQSLRDQLDWGARDRLPWDNTPVESVGPRLGRVGPGTPFEPLPGGSRLRQEGWYWNEQGQLVPPDGAEPSTFRPQNAPPPATEVRGLIADANGHVGAAAERAGVSDRTFYRWMERYNLRPSDFR